MKKSSTIWLLLAFLTILCLLMLAGFVAFLMHDTSSPASPAPAPQTEQNTETEATEIPTQILEAGDAVITNPYGEDTQDPEHSYIFVGDSRTVGMKNALAKESPKDACTFVAKSGEGYYWFYHTGIVELEEKLHASPYSTVIFNLGVNDLKEVDRYISLYKEIFSEYHDPTFYIMSVNPVDDERCLGASNEGIKEFNAKMQEAFPDKYLNCYDYLLSQDFATSDGLHYPDRVYLMVHRFVIDSLTQEE